MAIIVFASSKGGAGKTTACVITACELARQCEEKNIRVALIDADPNQHTAAWANLEGKPENIDLYANVSEESILDTIEEARNNAGFVLVDLEGVASNSVTYAVSQADLVIIPCQPSQNDAKEAVKTAKTIKNSSRMIGREIPFSILFARVSAAFLTKNAKYLQGEFEAAKIDQFKVSLIDREAFRNIFSFGGSVNELSSSTKREKISLENAAQNSLQLVEEIKVKIKNSMSRGN